MPIITDPDGTRYRCAIEDCPGCLPRAEPSLVCPAAFCCKPLPHIPDWPIPGPAPQFLSDDPACHLGPGDWYVNETSFGWAVLANGTPADLFRQHKTLGDAAKNSSVGKRA